MYRGIQKMEEIIDYIELNLASDLDYEDMAARMTLSVYEFRRIFAFIVGCPLSEYVRKRRLSLAACELAADKGASIRRISDKYGYSTVSAFSKAFSEYHGFSPTACRNGEGEISLFQRPKFELQILGGDQQSFQIISDKAFAIRGFCDISDHSDTCCCEQVWNSFYETGADRDISSDKLYVSYKNDGGRVLCCIGERTEGAGESDGCVIPECLWLTVKMNTTDDDAVNKKYNSLLYEILPSAKLKRVADIPTVEVFPADMTNDNFEWEIRIPIEKE